MPQEKITKEFKITATPEVMKRFENFLCFLHFNGGHSGLFGMYFDGDGSDVLKCEPAPEETIGKDKKKRDDVSSGYHAVEIANEDGYSSEKIKIEEEPEEDEEEFEQTFERLFNGLGA